MTQQYRGGHRRLIRAIQRACQQVGIALIVSVSSVHAATLTWDASGNNPTNPQPGSGNWDMSTANWSNGTSDVPWVDGDIAVFPGGGTGTVTIDDSSGDVEITGITFNANYTISALQDDTLNAPSGASFEGTGKINAPIDGGGFGVGVENGGVLTLTGQSAFYVGLTSIGSTLVLANGTTLGNATIIGTHLIIQGTASIGSGGNGSSGGQLGILTQFGQGISNFSMADGTIGTFTIRQQNGFHGRSLLLGLLSGGNVVGGTTLSFDLGNTAADKLINSGPGTASVVGTNIINILTAGDAFLTPGDYPLISVPSGGLTGTFDFANGLTTESVTVGGTPYTLQLTNSDTSEVLTVLPEPGGVMLAASGLLFLRRQRRK